MAGVVHVSDADFEREVLKSDRPVIVDFFAEWCGPCRQIAPIIEQLAVAYGGKVKIAKLDVDESPLTAGRYNIRSIPMVLAFKNGQVVEQMMGVRSRSTYEEVADRLTV